MLGKNVIKRTIKYAVQGGTYRKRERRIMSLGRDETVISKLDAV